MDRTQVTHIRNTIRKLKNDKSRTAEWIEIPTMALYANTKFSASIVPHLVIDDDGKGKVRNPEWTEINEELSLLQELMADLKEEKKEKETVRLNNKAAQEAANKAAQEERDKAARENRDKKAQEKLEKAERKARGKAARKNRYAGLVVY